MAVTRFFAPALLVTLGVLLITIWLDFNEEKPLRPLGSVARFNDNPGRNKDYITRQRKQDLYITGTSFCRQETHAQKSKVCKGEVYQRPPL